MDRETQIERERIKLARLVEQAREGANPVGENELVLAQNRKLERLLARRTQRHSALKGDGR